VDLTRLLARTYTKVTFVGGEPTLYPRLSELLAIAKSEGAMTNVVTNGSRIDPAWLERMASRIDFLTLSIDSDDATTHRILGRATLGRKPLENRHYGALSATARAVGIGVKVNTVVSTVNSRQDMSALVRALAPARWKILQAAPVAGQNDTYIKNLVPPRDDFDDYVTRHEVALADTTVRIVPEPIDLIRGSYVMVDPLGRFFDSSTGAHRYSAPILDVGIDIAFADVAFDAGKFRERGGDLDFASRS